MKRAATFLRHCARACAAVAIVGAALVGASASAANKVAAQARFGAYVAAVDYTYDPDQLLRLMVRNELAKARIEALEVDGGWTWVSGCVGTLARGASCVAKLRPAQEVACFTPQQLHVTLKVGGRQVSVNALVYQVASPYALTIVDQKSVEGGERTTPNVVSLPATKVGERGDSVEVQIEASHFLPLELRTVSVPAYIEVENGCAGRRLPSFVVQDDRQARQCRLLLRFNPTNATQSDGELKAVLSDGKREYPIVLQLRARPWQPLYARKISAVEGELYLLLRDASLWRDATGGGWTQVATGVDDFFAGPDHGLVIRQGDVARARGDGYDGRFGRGGDTSWDASIREFPWVTLPGPVRSAYVAKDATYYWEPTGQLWEAGLRHQYWDGQGRYPGEDQSPQRVSHPFMQVYQDDDAVSGIDAQGRLWMRGEFYDRDADNVGVPVHASDWVLREMGVAQYMSCGGDELKLDLDGDLYARGHNFSGALGAGDKVDLARWTRVNTGVTAFTIDCSRLGIPHSFRSLYALKKDGTLWGVGSNGFGKLGVSPDIAGRFTRWRQIARDVVSFEANAYNLLMLKSDGSVWASGALNADISQRTYRPRLEGIAPLGDFR